MCPPPAGLASNSNYLMGSGNCASLQSPTVTIKITEDLIIAPQVQNFGFQLNCYSPQNVKIAWQQYLIVPHLDSEVVNCGYQGYLNGKGQLIDGNPNVSLGTPRNATIPANWTLTMALISDTKWEHHRG